MFLFTLSQAIFVLSSAQGLGMTELVPERRRGFGIVFCTGICTAACAVGTGGIGFPTPAGVACEFVCVSACTASTACFDENAEIRTFDENTGELVKTKISDLANKKSDPEVQTADFLGDGSHLKATTETLEAVVLLEGDWEFYEITATTGARFSTRRNSVALNTTDDHGWIVVDSEGSNGCVVHAAEVKVGDHVLVFPEDRMTPTVAKVTSTRSFRKPVKYAAYTESGLLVANSMLTTVFCDHNSNDCAAELTLKNRLSVWKQRHEEKVRDAHEKYSEYGDLEEESSDSSESSDKTSTLRDEVDELRQKVDKVQKTLKRFKRKVAKQMRA